jgi:hypothetical protein
MTPKEKSMQLIYAFEAFTDRDNELEFAKQCALIAVDEILDAISGMVDEENGYSADEYYQEVKQEINKL